MATENIGPDDAVRRLQAIIAVDEDIDRSHEEADELLCQILKQYGYQDLVHLFEEMPKWYS